MHISEVFMDLIAYVVYILKTVGQKQPTFEEVRSRIMTLLADGARQAADFPPEDYDQARFAVCAWIDEAVMNSSWNERNAWQREPLQMKFYQTSNAGELFFERLNSLLPHQNDVREVYYLCLAMGFMGRYCKEEDRFLLDQLKTSNLKVLTGSSVGVPSLKQGELFPDAYPAAASEPTTAGPAATFSLMNILFIALPPALFGVLYGIFLFVLKNVSHTLISVVP